MMTVTTTELLKAWFIFSFSLGCWTCLNLWVNRTGDGRVKKTILVFIVLLLIPPLNAYITLTTNQPIGWLLTLHQQITWTLGPLMVLLIRYILLQPTSSYHLILHALPFIFGLIYGLSKMALIPFPVFFAVLFTQVFSYLGYAIHTLQKHRGRLISLTSHHKNTSYYWLLYLVVGLVFVMFIDFYIYTNIYLGHIQSYLFLAIVGSVVAIYVNTIALFSVYQPGVFFNEPLQVEVEEIIITKPTLRSVELSPEAAMQLDEQLQQLIHDHKPHLDEDISLGKLAALLGVTTHQLSELLNIHKSTNFYEFLNNLRFAEALKLLNNTHSTLTIADIVYQSGFNNRNSFYKVFKEKTGVTPNQYKKTMG